MSSVPLRARSLFVSFDAETGSRRPRGAAFVAGLLVVLLTTVGLVAGVSAANAHMPEISADCYSLEVDLTQYTGTNHVFVEIGDEVKVDDEFADSFSGTFTFDDPTVVNTWTVIVTAHDDPEFSKGWSVAKENQTTTPCAAPELTLDATVCDTVDGATTLTATISKLVDGQTYTGRLVENGQEIDEFVATTAGKTWPGMEAGATYVLTVTSDQRPGLTESVETHAVGCPQNSQLQVVANQCTATDADNASAFVTASSLVVGRSYVARVFQNGAQYGSLEYAFVAGEGETSKAFTIGGIPENLSGLTVVLLDVAAGTTVTSAGFSTNPCPDVPTKPLVAVEQCSAVDGDLEITVTPTGLVPTRSYVVLVNDVQVDEFTATSSSEAPRTYPIQTAGTYTVKIADKLVPAVVAAADPVDVEACPPQPSVALTAVQCTVPGGKGSITATFADLAADRGYEVTISEDGNAMAAYPATTIDATTTSKQFTDLKPGSAYVITVTDAGATTVKDAASLTLQPCSGTPTISATAQCEVMSNTTHFGVSLDKLTSGLQYFVTIKDDTGAHASAPVLVTGGAGAPAPSFQVPNGKYYTIAVTQATDAAVTASTDVYAAVCDLSTLPLPTGLRTLAVTGAGDTTMPMLGALGLVQFGFVLLALAAVRRSASRRRTA